MRSSVSRRSESNGIVVIGADSECGDAEPTLATETWAAQAPFALEDYVTQSAHACTYILK